MKVAGKIAVITGAASGIGAALARRFSHEGAQSIAVADVQTDALEKLSKEIGAMPVTCDVTDETQVIDLITQVEKECGEIDIYCSNAGIALSGGEHARDTEWSLNWNIHVMAHVYAARQLTPKMTKRGNGYFVITASAAGLLTHINSATYSVTKHAAVAFAEYLAINHGPSGVKVSVLCPQAVRTAMTAGNENSVASVDGMMEPDELTDTVIDAMDNEDFLILPHPQVLDYMQRKSGNYDRWLRGMQRLAEKYKPNTHGDGV